MPFALFLCGPRVEDLAPTGTAIVEELAGRRLASQVLCTTPVEVPGVLALEAAELPTRLAELRDMEAAAVVLLQESKRATREALIAHSPEAVVVDWCRGDDPDYQASEQPHCSVTDEGAVLDGMAEVFAVLEGLGYVDFAQQGSLSPEQDAELVEKLKELGYV